MAETFKQPTFTVHQVGHKDRELIRTPYSDIAELFARAWLNDRLGGATGTTRNILDHHATDAERAQYDLVIRKDGEFYSRYGWRHAQTLVLTLVAEGEQHG